MLSLPKLFQNPQYLAQVGHGLGGAWIIALPVIFAGYRSWWMAWVALLVFSAVKEYWYDYAWKGGEHDSLSDSNMDFVFYHVGAAVSFGVLTLAHHLHRLV